MAVSICLYIAGSVQLIGWLRIFTSAQKRLMCGRSRSYRRLDFSTEAAPYSIIDIQVVNYKVDATMCPTLQRYSQLLLPIAPPLLCTSSHETGSWLASMPSFC